MAEKNLLNDLADNAQAQSWMDNDFFEKVIKQYFRDDGAKVKSFEVSPGAKPGENFASTLYRVKIEYTSTKVPCDAPLSIMIKTMPEKGNFKADMIDSSPLFDTEIKMYSVIFPQFQAIWESAKDNTMILPKLIYQSKAPKYVIALEDISVNGFEMAAFPPEDFEVSKMIAQRLAKFHAASFFLANEKNVDFSEFKLHLYDLFVQDEKMKDNFKDNILAFVEEVKTWEGFEEYVPKLEEYANNYDVACKKCYEPNKGEDAYNVLNHSDHHIKNSMFKKENGIVKEVSFIDHQLEFYGSPAIDLMYSLYFDLSYENRKKYRDDYIMYYHTEFVKALKSYGFLKKTPSLNDLQIELLKKGPLEVMMATVMSSFLYIDWASVKPEDFDMGEGTKRFRRRCAANPAFVEVMKTEFPRFFCKGFF